MYIFIALLIYKFIKGTFQYEKVTRFGLIIIPLYAAFMMALDLKEIRSLATADVAVILLFTGIAIGFFQAGKTQIRDTGRVDSSNRPIIEVKRNWPYLVGWLVSFAIAAVVEVLNSGHFNLVALSHEFFEEVLRDLSIFVLFSTKIAWYIWVLNFATSFAYSGCLIVRYPKIREAIQRKKRRQ